MAYVFTENSLGWQPIADKSTTQNHPLGTIRRASDPTYGEGEFIYLKGVASCAAHDWVTYAKSTFAATRASANGIGPVAIAMAATTASYYGWFQIAGKANGGALTLYASGAAVFLTATAGKVDDSSVAGDLVVNATGASASAVGSGVADFMINRPFVTDRTVNK